MLLVHPAVRASHQLVDAQLVRRAGVWISLIGTIVAGLPGLIIVFQRCWSQLANRAKALWIALKSAARWPWELFRRKVLRRPRNVELKGATAFGRGFADAGRLDVTRRAWQVWDPPRVLIQRLHEDVEGLRTEVKHRAADLDQTKERLTTLEVFVRQEVENMKRSAAARETSKALADARGLPPLGAGIVLSGFYGFWGQTTALGATSVGIGVLVTLAFGGSVVKDMRARRQERPAGT